MTCKFNRFQAVSSEAQVLVTDILQASRPERFKSAWDVMPMDPSKSIHPNSFI